MSKVYLIDRMQEVADKLVVKLPHNKFLLFRIDDDYFIDVITGDTPISEELMEFICSCDKYDNILKSAIKKSLTTLTYSLYITTFTIDEIIRRLNIANLEEVIWSMICDEVIEEFKTLYVEYNKKR